MKYRILIGAAVAALLAVVAVVTTASAVTNGVTGKDVKITATMTPVDANGRMHTVVRLKYQNLTDRSLKLTSYLTGYIDPRSEAHLQSALHTDAYPRVISSSANVHVRKADGSSWKMVLPPQGTAAYQFTIQAVGQRLYCLEDVVFEGADSQGMGTIAGTAGGCADIVDHKLVYPDAQVRSFSVKFGVAQPNFLPQKKADRVRLQLHNPGPGNYLKVTFMTTAGGKPFMPSIATFPGQTDLSEFMKTTFKFYAVIPVDKTRKITVNFSPGADRICVKNADAWQCASR